MEFENLLTLMKTMSDSDLTEFSYEEHGVRIMMRKHRERSTVSAEVQMAAEEKNIKTKTVSDAENRNRDTARKMSEPEGNLVKSPLVGVFYAAPAEDAAPFVRVGDRVEKDQTLAIVEAMKLMNEIESDFTGTIAEVLVENGQAVEYGQPLFRII